ncbi:MAG: type I restriction enzyme HsdR N-terminal domain-containing protein [Desulfobacterales bacterium]|jgi:hypothetical protein|nr:type I restriction enzyme HsdR N-terminal domain-containing protein [Desulfobacterales bacterium]
MPAPLKPYETLVDFVTGKPVPNIGAEENRQAVERLLVEQKGFDRGEIEVEVPIAMEIGGETYRSAVDLVVKVAGRRVMALRCAAGSLGSCEREILAAARLLDTHQIPFAVVSDGKSALVLDTVSGRLLGEGLTAIPTRAETRSRSIEPTPLPGERRLREELIFRTYDRERVNAARRGGEV